VILSELEFVIPKGVKFDRVKTDTLKPFSDDIFEFLEELSKELLGQKEYSELISLGFWLRKAHIKKISQDFLSRYRYILPRGVVFHIAPSNVDTIFVYSFVLSMMCGNVNILRIGQKTSVQILTLLGIIQKISQNYKAIQNSLYIARYGYDDKITSYFSSLCDVRIIWGGDDTIDTIRQIPIKSTAIELTFADKFSFAVLNLEKIELNDLFFEKLYRDCFTFMQQACSSVRAICFLPVSRSKKEEFWKKFEEYVDKRDIAYEQKEGIDRFTASVSMAIEKNIKVKSQKLFYKIELSSLRDIDRKKHCGLGVFYDIDIENIEELLSFSTKKEQTLVVAGIEEKELISAIKSVNPVGFDRYVRVGEAMNFSSVWDGFDILVSLSRIIDVDI